jgi:hypothetical protein
MCSTKLEQKPAGSVTITCLLETLLREAPLLQKTANEMAERRRWYIPGKDITPRLKERRELDLSGELLRVKDKLDEIMPEIHSSGLREDAWVIDCIADAIFDDNWWLNIETQVTRSSWPGSAGSRPAARISRNFQKRVAATYAVAYKHAKKPGGLLAGDEYDEGDV